MTTDPIGISITDHEGKILRNNARYNAIVAGNLLIHVGKKPHEVCKAWFNNFEQHVQIKEWPAMQAITLGRPVMGVEIDVQRLDGSFGTILESAKPIKDTIGRVAGAIVITQDITEQIQQERTFFQSLLTRMQKNTNFHSFANSIPQLVWTATVNGPIEHFNDYVQQYQGFQRLKDGSWFWEEAVHPADLPDAYERVRKLVENGKPFKMQCRLLMADGTYRWHTCQAVSIRDTDGKTIKWLGIARDIHEQKIIEQALFCASSIGERYL